MVCSYRAEAALNMRRAHEKRVAGESRAKPGQGMHPDSPGTLRADAKNMSAIETVRKANRDSDNFEPGMERTRDVQHGSQTRQFLAYKAPEIGMFPVMWTLSGNRQ